MSYRLAALGLCLATVPVSALAAPVTYTGTHQVGGRTATLTIVTDGSFGTLVRANIFSFSATLVDGTTSLTLFRDLQTNTGNGGFTLTAALQASASSLILPFIVAATNNEIGIVGPQGFQDYYAAGKGSVFSASYAQTVNIAGVTSGAPITADFVLGTSAATSAVPEPASWGMMLLGFAAAGAASRYRRRAIKVAFAA